MKAVPQRERGSARLLRAACGALLAGAFSLALAQAPTSWYQGPHRPDASLHAIEITPVWRDRQDGASAVVTESAVVYLREGRLVATELASGWQQWSYGSGIVGPVRLVQGLVIVAETGRITALDSASGQPVWSADWSGPPIQVMEATEQVLVVGSGAGGYQTLSPRTGALLQRFEAPGPGQLAHVGDGLLLLAAVYGEPGVRWYHAYDLESGEELWRGRGWQRLLGVHQGLVYLLNQAPPATPPASEVTEARFSVSVVNAATGVRVEHWQYDFGGAVQEWLPLQSARAVLTDDALFVSNTAGNGAFRFALGGATAPTATYQVPGGGAFRAGPYQGLLFFEGSGHRLLAAPVSGGSITEYLFEGTQLSRLDLLDLRAYMGRTDGTFLAVDLATARVRYLLRTSGTGFGPTVDAGAYVVVQTTSEVLVLEDVE